MCVCVCLEMDKREFDAVASHFLLDDFDIHENEINFNCCVNAAASKSDDFVFSSGWSTRFCCVKAR